MRDSERIRNLKNWVYVTFAKGRLMKAPKDGSMKLENVVSQEPGVYLAWQPALPNAGSRTLLENSPYGVTPGIVIMPTGGMANLVEGGRFDERNGIRRSQEMGYTIHIKFLFSVYEPGIVLPGYGTDGIGYDMTKIIDGTEQGFFLLTNWIDDFKSELLRQGYVPGTDLLLEESSLKYSYYTEGDYLSDKRPVHYGFVDCDFYSYANNKDGGIAEQMLN